MTITREEHLNLATRALEAARVNLVVSTDASAEDWRLLAEAHIALAMLAPEAMRPAPKPLGGE